MYLKYCARRYKGACNEWLAAASPEIVGVAECVNGPLLNELIRTIGHSDAHCADLFRYGADLFGPLPRCGVGDVIGDADTCAKYSRGSCLQDNRELFKSLREDKNAHALHKLTQEDAELRRMTFPTRWDNIKIDSVRLVVIPF